MLDHRQKSRSLSLEEGVVRVGVKEEYKNLILKKEFYQSRNKGKFGFMREKDKFFS